MINPIRIAVRFILDRYFRLNPPPVVKYWLHKDSARAKPTTAPDGSYALEIEGEDELYPGFPRGHILAKFHESGGFPVLSRLKHIIKNGFFNATWAEIERLISANEYDMVPPEKMAPAVRELHRALVDLENAEVTDDMKGRIRLIRTVLCFIMQEDDAYRFRLQWLMERLNMRKMKLSKADKYYFRGKYFKVDHKMRLAGVDWDAFQY